MRKVVSLLMVCPGDQPDAEEGNTWINSGVCASVFMAEWYMSRFVDEIKDMGGTGTVVTLSCPDKELAAEFILEKSHHTCSCCRL